jgi:hypothetical protein
VNTIEGDGQFVVGTTCRCSSQSERKVTDGTSHHVRVTPPDLQMWLYQRECSPTPATHEIVLQHEAFGLS